MALNIRDDTTTIQWRVTSLTYDPETYVVEFGTGMSNLDQTSSMVTSGNDITRQNFVLSVLLEGLVPSTQYFYRVMIRNRAGEVRTPSGQPLTFTTTARGTWLNVE